MKYLKIVLLLLAVIILSGCAEQSSIDEGQVAGFWFGLWNGMILFFSFVGSWFSDDILIYYHLNKGFLYDLGFLLGLGVLGSPFTVNVSYRIR